MLVAAAAAGAGASADAALTYAMTSEWNEGPPLTSSHLRHDRNPIKDRWFEYRFRQSLDYSNKMMCPQSQPSVHSSSDVLGK